MKFTNWRKWAFIFSLIGILQFMILTSVAMLFYAGGTFVDPNAPGYSFWANYLSDLGRTKAHSGRDNTISRMFFSIALCVCGITTIFFALAMSDFFTERKIERCLGKAGAIFIIIMGITTFMLPFVPWDLYFYEHDALASIEAFFGTIGRISFIIAILINKKYPNRYAYTYIVSLSISGIILLYLAFFAVPLENVTTTEELSVITTSQKIIGYNGLICELYIIYGTLKQLET